MNISNFYVYFYKRAVEFSDTHSYRPNIHFTLYTSKVE